MHPDALQIGFKMHEAQREPVIRNGTDGGIARMNILTEHMSKRLGGRHVQGKIKNESKYGYQGATNKNRGVKDKDFQGNGFVAPKDQDPAAQAQQGGQKHLALGEENQAQQQSQGAQGSQARFLHIPVKQA